MEHPDQVAPDRPRLVRTAGFMLVTVVVAFLALDDITTDHSASFGFERFALLCCWAWLFVVSARLWRDYPKLGAISVGALAFASGTLREIGPSAEPGLSLEYVVTVAFLSWFAGLSVYLATVGWRSRRWTASG